MRSETRNSNGELHSINDEPAIYGFDGTMHWYKNGEVHRDNDEPAVVFKSGTKCWCKDGEYHRDNNKPAIIYSSGAEHWYINGTPLNTKQIALLYKINVSDIKHLPWLLNEDEFLNSVIEKRMNNVDRI